MKVRTKLTPHTFEYEEQKINNGKDVNWVPYTMFFHPGNHRSPVVNTDAHGFRYSERDGIAYSAADLKGAESVRLIVGSSTVFGIGATTDRWTLSSCLSANDKRSAPWVNFGGLAFNSTQELMLMVMNRHLLPKVDEIVLFSGFNTLALARLSAQKRMGHHGAFFNCNQYFEMIDAANESGKGGVKNWLSRTMAQPVDEAPTPPIDEQIAIATDLTLRHLDIWRALARDCGARLTYVLQPLSGWVRPRGCAEEEALFDEFNQLGNFTKMYGDILAKDTCFEYASRLKAGTDKLDINFVNISPALTESLAPDQWLFVDRIHFTDQGHDFVARKILEHL